MRLKRWESPRREGRNDKGRGGAARARQLKKQAQMMRQKLKSDGKAESGKNNRDREGKENAYPSPFVLLAETTGVGEEETRGQGEEEFPHLPLTPSSFSLLPTPDSL